MKYFVRAGNTHYEIILDGETVTVDGRRIHARIEDIAGTPMQLLSLGNEHHRLHARPGAERGSFEISVGGHRLAVEALDERTRVIRALAGASKATAGPAHLVAPMPGLIVKVHVKEGDQVRAGQGLVVMEAMKMENELRASSAGTVKRVLSTPGSAVEKGALLLELE
jgi:biotin carboxyl carrier protein